MSSETILLVKGVISEMPKRVQDRIYEIRDTLMKLVKAEGPVAIMAIALAASEMENE